MEAAYCFDVGDSKKTTAAAYDGSVWKWILVTRQDIDVYHQNSVVQSLQRKQVNLEQVHQSEK